MQVSQLTSGTAEFTPGYFKPSLHEKQKKVILTKLCYAELKNLKLTVMLKQLLGTDNYSKG